MIYVAISSAVLIYFCVLIVLQPAARKFDRIKTRITHITEIYDAGDKFDNENLKKPFMQRFFKPAFTKIGSKLAGLFPKVDNRKLKVQLEKAGYSISPATYNLIQFLVILAFGAGFMLLALILNRNITAVVLFILLGLVFGMLIMKYLLRISIRKRKELMRRQMPEVLDLLSVSVEAGLGFDAALVHVIKRLKGPLTDELAVTHREISLGRARRDALSALGERTGLEEMISFAGAIIQAEQQGISLKNVLNIQAAQIRQQRRHMIEEKAMKAPVKIIIPLVLFIFPVILIVLLAPAVMNIMQVLGGL